MESQTTVQAIELFVGLVSAAAIVALVVRRIAIPYTVALVVLGLIATSLLPGARFQVTPDLVLLVLVPGLVFEAALRIDARELRRSFGGVVVLAVPGVLLTAAIVATILHVATGLRFDLGFVVGAMVAATDPVAVVSTFRRLRSPRRLATVIEAESLFNDGTAIVVFSVATQAVVSGTVAPLPAAGSMAITVLVSAAIGVVIGWLVSRLIATVDDHLVELTLSLAAAYGTYLVADRIEQSGIIATVVAGLVIGTVARDRGMSERSLEALDTVWEFFAFLVTALVFLLIGLAISVEQLLDALVPIAWGVVAVVVARALVVYGLLGVASRAIVLTGHRGGVPIAWLHVLFWAGLRGAIAVALALSLPTGFPERELLQEITFGVVLFILLVEGTTVEAVIDRVGAGRPEDPMNAVPDAAAGASPAPRA
jgi:CPA1 family monovalent cation:H+ antiporter